MDLITNKIKTHRQLERTSKKTRGLLKKRMVDEVYWL